MTLEQEGGYDTAQQMFITLIPLHYPLCQENSSAALAVSNYYHVDPHKSTHLAFEELCEKFMKLHNVTESILRTKMVPPSKPIPRGAILAEIFLNREGLLSEEEIIEGYLENNKDQISEG